MNVVQENLGSNDNESPCISLKLSEGAWAYLGKVSAQSGISVQEILVNIIAEAIDESPDRRNCNFSLTGKQRVIRGLLGWDS